MKQDDTPHPPAKPQSKSLYLTTQELAARWKITPMTLRRWRKAGKIKAAFMGRGVRFAMAEVERFERDAEV